MLTTPLPSSPLPPPPSPQWMEEALAELGVRTELGYAEDGSGTGAALIALLAAQ